MSECNTLHTPVRRNELSVIRKSNQTRAMFSDNTRGGNKNCDEYVENKRLNGSPALSSTRLYESVSFVTSKVEDCDSESNMWDPSSFIINVAKMEEGSSGEDLDSLSSDSCDGMEASIIHEQKHSTPQVVKFTVKAVSSTPNQEISSISRFSRNVFTQTNLTLNARDQDDCREHFKAYCVEIPDDEESQCKLTPRKSYLNTTSELTSPLSHLCSKKSINCDETPTRNKQLVRKLSLRSKTMICSAIEKSKDLPKKVLSRHKSMEEKRVFSNTFSLMPNAKTPPSYTAKVFHNPFDVDLPDRLSKTIFSPDVFENVVSPSQGSDDLRWTIEDISSINPVPIDEDFSVPSDEDDPERESQVQQEIDRYFSETHIVLSPDDLAKSSSVIKITKNNQCTAAAASTPRKVYQNIPKELKNSSTQTVLTLLEVLPEELEDSLKSFFKFFEDDDFNMSQCNLRRKLFFHNEDEPPSPVRFEINSSPLTKDMWKTESSPLSTTSRERHFTPVGRQQELSSPEMSPVVNEFYNPKMRNDSLMTCKKTLHNFFLGDSGRIKREKEVVNSTVISDLSSQPTSQDTGYDTEDGARSQVLFSTPTQIVL